MSLTPKQEMFCQKYVELGNASEAYRQSYNASKMKSETVTERASRLLKEYKVSARVKELQSQLEKKHDLTKDKVVNRLKQIIFEQDTICDDKINLQAMNKAIEILNKMQGWNEPEKNENVVSETSQLPDWFNNK